MNEPKNQVEEAIAAGIPVTITNADGSKTEIRPEVVELGTLRILNEAAVRKHALACSKKIRLGKFTRVGQDFLDEVQADVEAFVRGLDVGHGVSNDEMVVYESGFTTGALSAKLTQKCNLVIAKIIQRKVKRMPSVGVTLGRTR